MSEKTSPETVTTIRKDRVQRGVFTEGQIKRGPTHVLNGKYSLPWCGVKLRGFGLTINRKDTLESVTCTACLRAKKAGRQSPWRRR